MSPLKLRMNGKPGAGHYMNSHNYYLNNPMHMIQKMLLGCLLLVSIISCKEKPKDTQTNPAEIQTNYGIVKGTIEDSLMVFKGIPFAKPPIGDLRWKAPQPPESWEGVKQTTEYGPAPIQGNDTTGKREDCL